MKHLIFLCLTLSVIFLSSCGCNNNVDPSMQATAPLAFQAPVIVNTNVVYGNPNGGGGGGGDSTAQIHRTTIGNTPVNQKMKKNISAPHPDALPAIPAPNLVCNGKGICANTSVPTSYSNVNSIPVSFVYMAQAGNQPAVMAMSFNFNILAQSGQGKALDFYNPSDTTPKTNYNFDAAFDIGQLSPLLSGTIQNGTVQLQPPPPPGSILPLPAYTSVVVTFTVTPSAAPAPATNSSVTPTTKAK